MMARPSNQTYYPHVQYLIDGKIVDKIPDETKGDKMSSKRMCKDCKHRQKPNGEFPVRGWCDNAKSLFHKKYVYKGGTCTVFKSLKAKGKVKEGSNTTLAKTKAE